MAQDALSFAALEGHADRVDALAWLSNEQLATGSSDRTIKIWNVAEGKVERTLEGHAAPVLSVAVHPQGKLIASGGKDRIVKLWDLSSSEPPRDVGNHARAVYCVALSPDGRWLASCGEDDTRIRIWNVAAAKSHKELNAEDADDKDRRRSIFCVAFSPDSKQLASCGADRSLRLWDVEGGAQARRFEAVEYFVYKEKDKKVEREARLGASDAALYCAAFSPDGSRIAAAGADKAIRIWDRTSGELLSTITGLADYVNALQFAPQGDRLLTCGHLGHVHVWNLADRTASFHTRLPAFAQCGAYSPDGTKIAVGCADSKGYLFDAPQ